MMMNKLLVALLLGSVATASWALDPFVIQDIRVEGIQRTEAGTVFSYLPVKVGDTLTDEKASEAIKALFSTGFFKDVRLEADKQVLVVTVQERPAIGVVSFNGTKEFDKDKLKEALKQAGLAESRIFDRALLDRAEQELKRQYFSRGRYGVNITATVTPLERNRVAIHFDVNEGDVAKIHQIRILGNKAFNEEKLVDLFTLQKPDWFTWYTKNDQYSKQKLAADLEVLRSHYLDNGYLEFNIDSTQVSISPDKQKVFITVNLTEGEKYTVSGVSFAGDIKIPEQELAHLAAIKTGDLFSRAQITQATKAISDRLGNDGYAFANVNAAPEINKEKHEVAFTFFLDPGRRVYVRRINVSGNNRTRDEVIRREVRQMEGSWYAADKINKSRNRIDRLDYFTDVNVETPAVADTTDQVDVNFSVNEKPTGNLMLGLGYGSSGGLALQGSLTQNNVFGSGNYLSAQVNSGKLNKVYALSYTNPYYTVDGISRGFDIYKRNVDPDSVSLGKYKTSTLGGAIRFGVPLTDDSNFSVSLGGERVEVTTFDDSPTRYKDFVKTFGKSTSTLISTAGWHNDTRDSAVYTTKGLVQHATAELGMGGNLRYYKLSAQHQQFIPLNRNFTLMLNGEYGIGNGYSGKPLPFFKNFYAGGIGSVRGFKNASIGAKDENNDPLGGSKRLVLNAEIFFPLPGLRNDRSTRMSIFADAGAVYQNSEKLNLNTLRYSAGVSVSWISPIGPLRFSLANPLKKQKGDDEQRFQFLLGSVF